MGSTREMRSSFTTTVTAPALRSVGVEMIRVRKSDYAYEHDRFFNRTGTLLVGVFSNQVEGSTGKMSSFCSRWWKQDVINNYLRREHGLSRSDYVKWVGFSFDESARALRTKKKSSHIVGSFTISSDVLA